MLPPQPEPCCLFPSKRTGCDIKTLIPCCLVTDWHLSLSRSTELVGTVQEDTLLLLFLPRLASGKRSVPAMWLTAHIRPSTILFLTLSSLASAGKRCYPCNHHLSPGILELQVKSEWMWHDVAGAVYFICSVCLMKMKEWLEIYEGCFKQPFKSAAMIWLMMKWIPVLKHTWDILMV